MTSYMDGLRVFDAGSHQLRQKKDGTIEYDGSPADYEQWAYLIRGKIRLSKANANADNVSNDLTRLASMMTTGLQGQALKVVREVDDKRSTAPMGQNLS